MASRPPSSPSGRARYLSARQTEAYLLARDLLRRIRQAATTGPMRARQGTGGS
jgi:hypothetical protein